MFSAFTRSLPQVSIFHHPSSRPSLEALSLLRSALSSPYPPSKHSAPPLKFDLDIVEATPPTPDQLRTILSYLPSPSASPAPLSTFISDSSQEPQNLKGVIQLATENPTSFKWPVVVDWTGGRASIGDVEGVKGILEEIRKIRDGEN